MLLRDYQQACIDQIIEAVLIGKKRIIVCCPTGSGKTAIFLEIAKHAAKNGRRVLILTHRREIFHQTGFALLSDGIDYGRINADHPNDPTLPIQIAMVQSFYSQVIRRKKMLMPKADIVITDEFHHAGADVFQKVHALYPNSFIIGFTATPIRATGRGLSECADHLIAGPSIPKLINDGWLVPAIYYTPTIPDLKHLKVRGGDYIEKELEPLMNKAVLIGAIHENWAIRARDRQTIAFGVSVAHSKHIAEVFNSLGIRSAHIDGKTPERERDRIVDQFRRKEIQVLSNCFVFSEGFDVPEASCLIFARPTQSLGLYLQVCGRVLRPFPGKTNTIILDHSGTFYKFGPIEQEFEWKLEYGKKKTINRAGRKIIDKELKRWIVCKKCKRIFSGRIDCPDCGEIATAKGKPVPTFEAYLQEVGDNEKCKYATAEKAVWWAAFKFEAMKKTDYKRAADGRPARAYGLYQDKFGCWPRGFDKDIPAKEGPLDVLAWIKHSKIKWAMRQQNNRKAMEPQKSLMDAPKFSLEEKI